MKVALTGATGFIGSHVLTDLYKHGHDVTALVRNDDQADIVAARGATPTVSTSTIDRQSGASSLMRTGQSTQPVLVTPLAPTSTLQWSTQRSMHSPAPASRISKSAVRGPTAQTPPSPRTHRSMRLRWWRGRNRSNADCLVRRTCAESWSCPASPMVTAAEGFPGYFSARHETPRAT